MTPGPEPADGLTVIHGWFAAAVHVTVPAPACVSVRVCDRVANWRVPPLLTTP